jgi:cell division initiation protein
MALTPVEIRHITLGRSLLGYGRAHVDKLLDDIVASFEQVWRERADLADKVENLEQGLELTMAHELLLEVLHLVGADKVENLEQELVRHRELETLLRTTLVSAERASAELKEQARREAELVVTEARAEARKITRDATGDLDRMRAESRRIRSLLGAALATLGEGENGEDEAPTGEVRAA